MSRLYSIEQKDTEKKLDSVKEEKIMPRLFSIEEKGTKKDANIAWGECNSYITISNAVMKKLIDVGKLKKIEGAEGEKATSNKYYECKGIGNNVVLMHVDKNRYILLNRYAYCKKIGGFINVIKYLKELHFNSASTTNNRTKTICSIPVKLQNILGKKTICIERIIYGIVENGEIGKLKDNYIVHHKDNVFDARFGMTMYIDSKLHTGRKSHLAGFNVESIDKFNAVCTELKDNYKKLKDVDNAA